MTDMVYGVFTVGWERFDPPILKQLFYNEIDADVYADKLRNEEKVSWDGVDTIKTYYKVTIDELEIK